MSEHARIRNPSYPTICDQGKGITLPFGHLVQSWYLTRYTGCWHNEVAAISRRHMMPTPNSEPWNGSLAHSIGNSLGMALPWSEDEVVAAIAGGARKRRYLAAFDKLRSGLDPAKCGGVRGFVKTENTNLINGTKDPRLIQFRNYCYTARLAQWLGPIEKRLSTWKPRGSLKRWFPISERMVAKGLNPNGRADLVRQVRSHFSMPVEIGLDGRRWDAHVSVEALKWEHTVYRSAFPGDALLNRMLRQQLVNKGRTVSGIAYTVKGTRMSGDRNTGLGNCLVNLGLTAQAMKAMRIKKWHAIVDGDDCVLFLERGDVDKLNYDVYKRYGFVVNLEEAATEMRPHVEFCQARLLDLADGPRFVRNPAKVLAGLGVTGRPMNPKEWIRRIHTVATLESILNNGVPVLGPFADALLGRTETLMSSLRKGNRLKREWTHELEDQGAYQWMKGSGRRLGSKPLEITSTARLQFAEAWSLDENQQCWLEGQLVAMANCWDPPVQAFPMAAGFAMPDGTFIRNGEPGRVPL